MGEEKTIIERLAALEAKVDILLALHQEHRSSHLQFSLLGWGAVLTAIGAVVVAVVI